MRSVNNGSDVHFTEDSRQTSGLGVQLADPSSVYSFQCGVPFSKECRVTQIEVENGFPAKLIRASLDGLKASLE